ncbi:MAG: hypothetical protein ACI4V2_06190, partial [Alloprevotella sp.]
DRYLGLCVVLNGLILKRIDGLFDLFENTITDLVTQGRLIHFNEQGHLVTSVEKLYLNREEIDLLTETLRAGFKKFEPDCLSLPAVSYATSKDSCKDFSVGDEQDEIIKSSYTNGYTYIYKSKGFNTAQLNSYKGVLSKAYKEKKELTERYNNLQAEHAKTLRQKKQFRFVLILFIVILGCAIGLFSLNDNLNITRDALSSANDTISMQNDSLSSKTVQISNLHTVIHKLERSRQAEASRRVEAENNLENFKSKIRKRQPFIVKNTSFSFSSGYLSFDYYGMTEGSVSVKVKAFNDNGECYTNSSNIYIAKGDNSASIFVSRNLDRNKWYSFELLKDNIILGGDRH